MRIMLAIVIALTCGLSTGLAQQNQVLVAEHVKTAEKNLTYKEAYRRAQTGDKPLLVLVTASWCPPCVQMKQTTIPELERRNSFDKFHFAKLDYDMEKELAGQLIGDRGLPQMIMFEKSNGQWLRRYLTGIQPPAKVEGFMAQAGTFRTASSLGIQSK